MKYKVETQEKLAEQSESRLSALSSSLPTQDPDITVHQGVTCSVQSSWVSFKYLTGARRSFCHHHQPESEIWKPNKPQFDSWLSRLKLAFFWHVPCVSATRKKIWKFLQFELGWNFLPTFLGLQFIMLEQMFLVLPPASCGSKHRFFDECFIAIQISEWNRQFWDPDSCWSCASAPNPTESWWYLIHITCQGHSACFRKSKQLEAQRDLTSLVEISELLRCPDWGGFSHVWLPFGVNLKQSCFLRNWKSVNQHNTTWPVWELPGSPWLGRLIGFTFISWHSEPNLIFLFNLLMHWKETSLCKGSHPNPQQMCFCDGAFFDVIERLKLSRWTQFNENHLVAQKVQTGSGCGHAMEKVRSAIVVLNSSAIVEHNAPSVTFWPRPGLS